jgi:dipeptidyl aminopeptidase/acylaminoacyl peptidase
MQWSPDGSKLAFLANDTAAGSGKQIFVTKRDATELRPVTAMVNGVARFRRSADSQMLAFTADERPQRTSQIIVVGTDAPRHALWTIGEDEETPLRITSNDQNIIDFAWSPSGTQIAALVAKVSEIDTAVFPTTLVILDRGDGRIVRVVTEKAAGNCDITWSPDGKTIAAPILAPRKLSRRLALFPAEGGEPTFPFSEFHATPMSHVEWTADSRYLFVQFTENTRNQLIRLEPSTGKIGRFSDDLTNFWGFGMDRTGTTFAFTAESQHDPPDIFVRRDSELHRVTDFNQHLGEFQLGKVKTIHWKSSLDGRTIYGVLITPPGFEQGTPCPTIVNLHSGPHWLWWEGWIGTHVSWGQYLASNGYAVFLPNHRGSIGRGWEFAEAHYLEWGRGDYQDVVDGVDWLVEKGIAHPDRLGIGGSSFGGYLTAWTITQTDRFKAAIVDAGWTDLVSSNLTIDAPEGLRIYMNGNVFEREKLYRSRSPLTHVQQCCTPTLIMHGQHDRRAPTDQGRMFHRALQLHGTATQLVIYKDEGHGLTKRPNQLDALRRVKDWFDRHLKPR